MFKKYEWKSEALHKRATKLMTWMLILMAVAIVILYALPGDIKALSMVAVIVGIVIWFRYMKVCNADKKLEEKRQIRHVDKL